MHNELSQQRLYQISFPGPPILFFRERHFRVPKSPLLAPTTFNPEIATFEQISPQNRHFFGTHVCLKFSVKSVEIFPPKKGPKIATFWPEIASFRPKIATFWRRPQSFQNRHFLSGESPPNVCRHWSFKIATLARNRQNWRPCL